VIVTVEQGSPVPPYEQLREQLTTMIRSRVLAPGSQLPPIRQLAGDLALATGTVARAYRELEADGLVESRGRHGTVVTDSVPALGAHDRRAELEAAAEAFATRVRHLGVGADEAVASIERALR
jgi:DNA-binding transcriptional regulator YhcF (GntR family)